MSFRWSLLRFRLAQIYAISAFLFMIVWLTGLSGAGKSTDAISHRESLINDER